MSFAQVCYLDWTQLFLFCSRCSFRLTDFPSMLCTLTEALNISVQPSAHVTVQVTHSINRQQPLKNEKYVDEYATSSRLFLSLTDYFPW